MASPLDFIRASIEAYNGSAVQKSSSPSQSSSASASGNRSNGRGSNSYRRQEWQRKNGQGNGYTPQTSSTTPSRTSPLEDYYNEQREKQAIEKARDIVDDRGRGNRSYARDEYLKKSGGVKSTTVDSRGNNSTLQKEYQRQNPNTPSVSTALSDDEKFQLQSAYADAANKYKDASKKAQSIRPEEGLDYATTLEKYRSAQQAATEEKAAAESEMDRLRKQLEFYNVELPDLNQNVFERVWGSVKGGSKQASGSLGGAAGYAGRVVTGSQNAVDKALRASGNEELSALYDVGTEEENAKAMQMQQAIADKSAELSESGGRDIERSKWGASGAGKFALDAVSQVPALAADMAANALLPGAGMAMMMGRSFGGGVQEAEAGGANLAQAGAYGAASAAVESLTEKLTGGLDIAYGKGFTDKVTERLIGKLAKSDAGRTAFRALTGVLGEGAEEFISSAVNPTIRSIYNGKSVGENYSEEQISDWLYDGLVGAALGLAGSGVSIATGADAKKNAELRSGDIDSAIELMTGKKASSEAQSVAETHGDITTPPVVSNDAVAHPVELNSTINNSVETQNADAPKNTAPTGTESTSINTDPATHTPEQQRVINEYVSSADKGIVAFIERVRQLKNPKYRNSVRYSISEVSPKAAQEVTSLTGVDVSGFENIITGSAVDHIEARHGSSGRADHSMSNINDLARVQYVLDNFDGAYLLTNDDGSPSVSDVWKNSDGTSAQRVVFYKKLDGTYYAVEATPDSKARVLAVESAFIGSEKNIGSTGTVLNMEKNSPQVTPEAPQRANASTTSIPTAEENVNRGQAENSVKDQAYYVDLARKLDERGWSREDIKDATGFVVDEHGNVYDEDTGEVHYDAQEEADKDAWNRAAEDFGEKNRDTIHEATNKAADFKTFLEDEDFLNGFSDSRYTEISDAVTEFKSKLAGVGDGHTPFSEFADYYKAMKSSDILGDLYSERVNEQVQLAKALSDAAQKNPVPHNVDRYRSAVTKAMQMASHYVEKASKVRTELNELTAAVKENGSKKKPYETQRNPRLRDEAKSASEKLGAKFIRYQIMPRQMFQMIDGFKSWEKGAGYRMADTIEKSAAKNQTVLVDADNFFSDVVMEKAYRDFSTGKTKSGVKVGSEELSMDMAVSLYKAIKTMGGPDAYRAQHVSGFALYNGNDDPIRIKTNDVSPLYYAAESAIESDPIAKAYVEAFDDMADYLGKETKKVSKEVDGTDIYTYVKGDYFPLTYSAAEGNFNWDKQKAQEFGLPDFKSLKDRTRTEGGYVNIAPVTMVTDGYIRRAADYIAFGELADTFSIMDYMHTFGTSTLVDSVKQNMGSEYGAWMENYVKDVQDINQTRAKSNYNGWSKLTRNFQTAVLVGNPGTPFKQKGSMWLAMSELDPRAVAKAAVTSLNPGNQQMKAARDNPLLQFRAKGNIDASISDALQDQSTLFGKMSAKSKVLKSIQNWIPAADVKEVSKVYLASCYDVQMKNPGIDVNSAKFKDMVDETFQRASMRTQSQYTMNMRDEISRSDNDLLKSLTMFQTQQRTNFNNLVTAFGEAKAAKGTEHASTANKARARAIGGFVASNIAYGAMSVVADGLRHKLKQYRDDDEEQQIDPAKIAIKVGESAFEGVLGTLVFGDTAANAINAIFDEDNTFFANSVGVVGALSDVVSKFVDLCHDPTLDNTRKFAGDVANLLGIPLNNAYTLLNSFGMYTADIISAMSRSKESGNILDELLKGTSAADIAGKKKAGLYSISDDPADDSLKILDSIRKAVDKLAPDQFAYTDENGDEVSYELTKADKEQYRKDAEASYNTGMDALLASAGYGKLDAKDKKAVDKALRDYAKNAAEQGYLDGKELDHDTGASAWMRNLSEDEVPKYLVAKQTLKGMYKDGKISDFAALDSYMDDLKTGFASLTSAQRDALSDSFPRIKGIYDAAVHDIPSAKWAAVYDKYMELDKIRVDGYNATDKATDLAAFIDKQGLTKAQSENLKEQFKFYSHIAAEPTRYERLIDAGYSPDKANELYYRLDNMSTDGNSNVSQKEAYARLSTMDDLTNAEKDVIWAIINSGWKTSYTKYDRRHRNDAPTQASDDTGNTSRSSSVFSAEDYYRALGLLK